MKRINLANLRPVFALILGVLTSFCFAPYEYAWLMFPLLAGWFHLLNQTNLAREALFLGWLFGVGLFGAGIYWVEISIECYGGAPGLIAWLITAIFISYLALYPALFSLGFKKIAKDNHPYWNYLVVIPLLYLLTEWLRNTLFTGFPWLNLGYAQIGTPLAGYAPILGIYGVTFFTLQISGCLHLMTLSLRKTGRFLICFAIIAGILGGGTILSKISWTIPGDPLTVEIVPGNIPQEKKWVADNFAVLIANYETLTVASSAELIVWPEAAIPAIWEDVDELFTDLQTHLVGRGQTLMFGVPYREQDRVYNGLIVYGADQGRYAKRHLLPFGEYWPGRRLFRMIYQFLTIPMSDFKAGTYQQKALVVKGHRIAPFICYEITYPSLMCGNFEAEMIVTISDDSWFKGSIESAQHLQIARMRSLEFGRMQILATNSGISALINEHGEIVDQSLPEETRLSGEINYFRGLTPFARILSYFYRDKLLKVKKDALKL